MMAASWPPKSPKAALLSSPSGRRKYQQYMEQPHKYTSPIKGATTTPSLRNTSARLFDEDENINSESMEEDEDEETLQLKLAAIEAKLKLKRLQQSKARLQAEPSEASAVHDNSQKRPTSARATSRLRERTDQNSTVPAPEIALEVPISPTKKPTTSAEPKSPGRVLLGIDKGIKGHDVSLRRARSTRDGTFQRTTSRLDRPLSRSSAFSSVRSTTPAATATGGQMKSFSEKMAESRSVERSREGQREAIVRNRRTGFKLNQAEIEGLRRAAEEAQTHSPPRFVKYREEVELRRDNVSRSQGESKVTSPRLKRSHTAPNLRSPSRKPSHSSGHEDSNTEQKNTQDGDASLFESFSQLHLSTRILPHSFLQRNLADNSCTSLRLPQLLKSVHAPLYELPESVVDYVVFGIIASKSSPQDHKTGTGGAKSAGSVKASNEWEKQWEDGSQNQRKFMVLQLTDLTWSVDLFLFGTALPRYHRLSLGTVVAILNPGIMPPKKGKEDSGAFSLTLHSGEDTVLEIGTARDLGFCKAVKRDGKECGSWVNLAKTEYCDWHLDAQISKTQAGRMGVNTGSNGSGLRGGGGGGGGGGPGARSRFNSVRVPGRGGEAKEGQGLLPQKEGQRFDSHTGSHYFITSSGGGSNSGVSGGPAYRSDRSAANLLDMDDDDPFIAEGQLSRDKESRLRKRLADEEKERSIARTLARNNSGGAGGEYIRQRLGVDSSCASDQGRQRSAPTLTVGILNLDPAGKANRKRPAESVRLSPVKKTRLLTEKGIRHPGRESLGGTHDHVDDDDLDIV
jgi:minichromosome maintenance protein 10